MYKQDYCCLLFFQSTSCNRLKINWQGTDYSCRFSSKYRWVCHHIIFVIIIILISLSLSEDLSTLSRFVKETVAESSMPAGGIAKVEWTILQNLYSLVLLWISLTNKERFQITRNSHHQISSTNQQDRGSYIQLLFFFWERNSIWVLLYK